jgi:hypothetical protein
LRREREEITVLFKTAPEKSRRDRERHSTEVIGINKNGELLRLYPPGLRSGEELVDFRMYSLLETMLTKPENDFRWESRKILGYTNLQNPHKKRETIRLIQSLAKSIEKLNIEGSSLGVVKPEILDIEIKVNNIETYDRQRYFSLLREFLEKGRKMPVEVRYIFKCKGEAACRGHKVLLLDWESNETIRNILREQKKPETVKKRIRECFFDLIKERELYFIIGTHLNYGTWMITGVFCPENSRNQSRLSGFYN